jgi:hypothetical protein
MTILTPHDGITRFDGIELKKPLPEKCTMIGNSFITSQILYEMALTLKSLFYERGWAKSDENLGASPFKSDLSIDTYHFQPHKFRWTGPLSEVLPESMSKEDKHQSESSRQSILVPGVRSGR